MSGYLLKSPYCTGEQAISSKSVSGVLAIATWGGEPPSRAVAQSMAAAASHLGSAKVRTAAGVVVASLGSAEVVRGASLILALDGRIDNRDELAAELGLRQPTDGQVVLAAYRRWGERAAPRLLGDFVLLAWDTAARRLTAARDPMGCRNLYYRLEGRRRALFATELKQLLADPEVPCQPNEAAVIADIAGLYSLPEMTAYEGIDQLAPGHAMTIEDGEHSTRRYWRPDDTVRRIRYSSEADYAQHFFSVYSAAVGARLRGSSTKGVLMSGSVDSASVVATAAWLERTTRLSQLDLHAFTWAFEELSDSDERSVAKPLAEWGGVPLTEVPADDAWPLTGNHHPDRDDPYSYVYQPLLQRSLNAARDKACATVLTGDRGDEVMGAWTYDDLGLLLGGELSKLRQDARAYQRRTGHGSGKYVIRQLMHPLLVAVWPPGRYEWLRERIPGKRQRQPLPPWIHSQHRLATEEIREAATRVPAIRSHARILRQASIFHVETLRHAEYLQRTFARFGIRHADPWADRRLVDFALGVPQWRLQRHSREKYLAVSAMRGIMPERLRRAMRQQVPFSLYQRAFNDREVTSVRKLLATSEAAKHGWIDAQKALANFEAYVLGKPALDFWPTLTVELWLRRWWT